MILTLVFFFFFFSYTPEGQLLPPAKSKKASPQDCANRVKNIASSSDPEAGPLKNRSYSVCLHSDMDGAVANVKAVRATIDSLNSE